MEIAQAGYSLEGHPARTGRLGSWFCEPQQPHPNSDSESEPGRPQMLRCQAASPWGSSCPLPPLRTVTQLEVSTNFTGIEVRQQEELPACLQTHCSEKSSHRGSLFPCPALWNNHLCISTALNVALWALAASWLGGGVEGGETLCFRRKVSFSLKLQEACVCGYLNSKQICKKHSLP